MVDDSELDYLRTFLTYVCPDCTVKHYSEIRKISAINDTRRILVFPGELISVDGKFYTKRYKIKISETSEANLMETFNNLIDGFIDVRTGPNIGYTNISWTTTNTCLGLAWDGTNYFTSESSGATEYIYKYDSDGVYVTRYNISAKVSYLSSGGIGTDGTYLYVLDGETSEIHKYDATGNFQESWDTSGEMSYGNGITWDGTNFWIVSEETKKVYKYTSSGTYTSTSFDISSESTFPWGMVWDGTYFWISDTGDKVLYRYDSNGVYTGHSIDYTDTNVLCRGLESIGDFLWLNGGTAKGVYKYNNPDYIKPSVFVYIELAYGNRAYEQPKTKRWYQDLWLDVEWSTE